MDRPIRVVIYYEMEDDEIIALLNSQYAELMGYEKELLRVMNNK